MERANLALVILSIEMKNAGSRQRSRLRKMGVQSLAVDQILHNLRLSMQTLRKNVKKLERLEEREHAAKRMDRPARNKLAGVNMNLTGTFGKPR